MSSPGRALRSTRSQPIRPRADAAAAGATQPAAGRRARRRRPRRERPRARGRPYQPAAAARKQDVLRLGDKQGRGGGRQGPPRALLRQALHPRALLRAVGAEGVQGEHAGRMDLPRRDVDRHRAPRRLLLPLGREPVRPQGRRPRGRGATGQRNEHPRERAVRDPRPDDRRRRVDRPPRHALPLRRIAAQTVLRRHAQHDRFHRHRRS